MCVTEGKRVLGGQPWISGDKRIKGMYQSDRKQQPPSYGVCVLLLEQECVGVCTQRRVSVCPLGSLVPCACHTVVGAAHPFGLYH